MHRYQKVYQDLLDKIMSGALAPGMVLPAELELARSYQVSRPTIRHALQMLQSEGLVERRKRRGTMVLEPKMEQGFATSIRSFHDEMQSLNRIPRTDVLACSVEPADAHVADRLGLGEGDPVMRLVRVRYADDLPNVLVRTYVPHVLYPGIETTDFTEASLYATMRLMASPVIHAHRTLDVALADREIAQALRIEPSSPVFVFHTVAQNASGQCAEYSIATYRGDTNSFEFDTQLE
ncbi:MAG: GntR family transcriptional regulator [Atopobiaceae bacterium]|nr:GntR family transcriptional regulator [Atopobiaceae bacterium]